VIDPANQVDGVFDLLVEAGRIVAIERPGKISAPQEARTIDVSGRWIAPGLVDAHVHLRDPGFPEKETISSGLRAAAAGGFTTVAAMANTQPVNDSTEVTRYILDEATKTHAAKLIPVGAVTRGLEGRENVDYAAMAAAGARLFSDDGMPVDREEVLTRAMREVGRLGYAMALHEEDRDCSRGGALNDGAVSRHLGVTGYPVKAESIRIKRDIDLARSCGVPVHIAHVSAQESLELIREGRKGGAQITCEATPHHFTLDESAALRWGPNAKMNPPLRTAGDIAAIRAGLADGTIDIIATDHAPHDPESKQLDILSAYFNPANDASRLPGDAADAFAGAANGVVGLETALGLALDLVHKSLISPTRLVELMALHPARLLRIPAGTLTPGVAADITVIDPELEWTVQPSRFRSKSRNTPFAEMRLRGKALLTIVDGEIVYDARKGDA